MQLSAFVGDSTEVKLIVAQSVNYAFKARGAVIYQNTGK